MDQPTHVHIKHAAPVDADGCGACQRLCCRKDSGRRRPDPEVRLEMQSFYTHPNCTPQATDATRRGALRGVGGEFEDVLVSRDGEPGVVRRRSGSAAASPARSGIPRADGEKVRGGGDAVGGG